ncbi:MAG: hypothetical protein ACP5DQ_06060, partial [Bacteroidales bacterium]
YLVEQQISFAELIAYAISVASSPDSYRDPHNDAFAFGLYRPDSIILFTPSLFERIGSFLNVGAYFFFRTFR